MVALVLVGILSLSNRGAFSRSVWFQKGVGISVEFLRGGAPCELQEGGSGAGGGVWGEAGGLEGTQALPIRSYISCQYRFVSVFVSARP